LQVAALNLYANGRKETALELRLRSGQPGGRLRRDQSPLPGVTFRRWSCARPMAPFPRKGGAQIARALGMHASPWRV